jgi:transcriptional regulator with XRE-family HTH domain
VTDDALAEIRDWVQDVENRQSYGAESIKLDLAVALAEARKSQRFTQAQLAELTGVSQAYIAKLESGEANPTIGHVGALVAAMWLRTTFRFQPLLEEHIRTIDPVGQMPSAHEDRVLTALQLSSGTADSTTLEPPAGYAAA